MNWLSSGVSDTCWLHRFCIPDSSADVPLSATFVGVGPIRTLGALGAPAPPRSPNTPGPASGRWQEARPFGLPPAHCLLPTDAGGRVWGSNPPKTGSTASHEALKPSG